MCTNWLLSKGNVILKLGILFIYIFNWNLCIWLFEIMKRNCEFVFNKSLNLGDTNSFW